MDRIKEDASEDSKRNASRTAMAARLGVHGDFIHVPQLSRALGISSTTIHAQMRRGNFPMPHRKVGNVLVVKLDDYVRWFDGDDAERPPPKGMSAKPVESAPEAQEQSRAKPSPSRALGSEGQRRAEVKARIQREVRERMRRKGFDV